MPFLKNVSPIGMETHNFKRILIANRGEIALRIVRAIHALGKEALVVHAPQDRDLPFVREANERYLLEGEGLADTYLNAALLVEVALDAGADAIHPGYGFLSENADFARLCEEKGLRFIGPRAETIALMGEKASAREKARELGLPVLEGMRAEPAALLSKSTSYSYPLLVKAAGGGGGRGMRLVERPDDLEAALKEAGREALNAFGTDELYLERYLKEARHIEVQVLSDHHGRHLHFFERECSIQRRHQKVIEEAPSPSLIDTQREALCADAVRLTTGIDYRNAGTVEFLVDQEGKHYFLEMNTRIQVEHPVTELICSVDLVCEQIRIAESRPLDYDQSGVHMEGHAMEVRLYAEDPEKEFMPATGNIAEMYWPDDPDFRVDAGYEKGATVHSYFDPMLGKLIAWGRDREAARKKLLSMLDKGMFIGFPNNLEFLRHVLDTDDFQGLNFHTAFLDQQLPAILEALHHRKQLETPGLLLAAASLHLLIEQEDLRLRGRGLWEELGPWSLLPHLHLALDDHLHRIPVERTHGQWRVEIEGTPWELELLQATRLEGISAYQARLQGTPCHFLAHSDGAELWVKWQGYLYRILRQDVLDERHLGPSQGSSEDHKHVVHAPLSGRILEIPVKEGEWVKENQVLLVIESMKMENKVLAPASVIIQKIHRSVGEQVHTNQIIITLEPYDRSTDH